MKLITKSVSAVILAVACLQPAAWAQNPTLEGSISVKSPGNPAATFSLSESHDGILLPDEDLPLEIRRTTVEKDGVTTVKLEITAENTLYYNIGQVLHTGFRSEDCLFYMPGFWYRKNLRSPDNAPSFRSGKDWTVREDRLSTPLTGIYNTGSGEYCTVLRISDFGQDAQPCHSYGEVILSDVTSVGYTGFSASADSADINFGFPYQETPASYMRKLTLAPPVFAFSRLDAGETHEIVWEIRKGKAVSWSDFVAGVWEYSFDRLHPQPMTPRMGTEEAKALLSRFYTQSYTDSHPLKYYSGVELRIADCRPNGLAETGFLGRVLLNAFNALEYGLSHSREDLAADARAVFDSYLEHGFTPGGLFRERVYFDSDPAGYEDGIYSIRRQSESIYAILLYLDFEKRSGRSHPEWENRISALLDRLTELQNEDGSFPRKFSDAMEVKDPSGGSSSSAILPLTMGYRYFGDKSLLKAAERTAEYLETGLISEADYFSSTLDANCEDKEASLYAATAMYYMALVEKDGKKAARYSELCRDAAYFALSWYYLWDVPFAQGQMLGDVGFKSRGWGNVSVENNHVDVFIFEFADVIDYLAGVYGDGRFSAMSGIIRSSMLQLIPEKGSMYGIALEGYCPEVVQHTNWDYGRNGKGFYNDIFAPGWAVASLWQMLSPGRAADYFGKASETTKVLPPM